MLKIQIKRPTQLKNLLVRYINTDKQIVILCIGTDKSTGDSLGPLVGHFLKNKHKKVIIEGSLKNPLTAKNLGDIIKKYKNDNNFIITIDSCVGAGENIGKIFSRNGALKPGLALGKDIDEIGNLNIQDIVARSLGPTFFNLQYTRLALVMEMAEIISQGINKYISHIERG